MTAVELLKKAIAVEETRIGSGCRDTSIALTCIETAIWRLEKRDKRSE